MGDAGEGLIDQDSRIQERMEELERETRHAPQSSGRSGAGARARVAAPGADRARVGSSSRPPTSGGARRIAQAIDEIERRMAEVSPHGLAAVHRYHDGTKHHFNRFARSLGYLDWASQPRPVSTFSPAVRGVPRPSASGCRGGTETSATCCVLTGSLGLEAVSAIALVAARQPSSGNLHPTEAYVVCGRNTVSPPRRLCITTRPSGTNWRCAAVRRRDVWRASHDADVALMRPDLDPLAGSVEIRRARIPVLPARSGTRHRRSGDRRRDRRPSAHACARLVATRRSPH